MMRNIEKIIDDLPEGEPVSDTTLNYIADLITLRTGGDRTDLIHKCAYKFKVDKSVIEARVEDSLKRHTASSVIQEQWNSFINSRREQSV